MLLRILIIGNAVLLIVNGGMLVANTMITRRLRRVAIATRRPESTDFRERLFDGIDEVCSHRVKLSDHCPVCAALPINQHD